MTAAWAIVDGPVAQRSRGGFRRYRFTLAREALEREVFVDISIAAVGQADTLSPEVREVVASLGRSWLERHLGEETPPRAVMVTTRGVTA